MDDALPDEAEGLISRPPQREDVVGLCRELNRLGAKYVVVGGFAVIEAGYARTTGDIDLLVDPAADNAIKVFEALATLPDGGLSGNLMRGTSADSVLCAWQMKCLSI